MQKAIEYFRNNEDKFRDELFELLKIPSISTDPAYKQRVSEAAQFLEEHLKQIGLEDVHTYATDGNPIVVARHHQAGPEKPTVLIYGHYDVQPPDPEELWETPPFEPSVRDGKVYARGASDDKGQVFIHVKSLESYLQSGTPLPVNITLLIEGEEEIGSPHLKPFVEEHQELLDCDMVLISDTAMYGEDRPSLCYGLRGMSYLELRITGPSRDLHSGSYGGTVQNPLNALCDIIDTMKDGNGVIQIPEFYDQVRPLGAEEKKQYEQLPFDEEAYRREVGVGELFGEQGYTTPERRTARPTLDMNGIWGGYQGEGAKTVLPAKAGAKVSMRLVPDQDPKTIADRFRRHVERVTPPGISVEIIEHHSGRPALVDLNFYGLRAGGRALGDVYQTEPLFTREGGSIPIVAEFQDTLGAEPILMGFGLHTDAIHSPNEHFSLKDFYRGIESSARFFTYLPEESGS